MDKKKIKSIVIFGCFLILMIVLTILLWPFIKSLATEEVRLEFKEKIDSLGVGGWFIMLGIQILQIVVAFIPGEPVEIVMGVFYGPWMGLVTCLLGILIGSIIVYILAKLIGTPFIKIFVDPEEIKKYKFLQNQKRVELTVFLLFFIPGVPKDVLAYMAPFLPIKPVRFFVIATIARIPSVITSTVLGDQLIEGNIISSIIVFAVTAVVSIAGILFHNFYIKKKEAKLKDEQ